MTKSDLINRMCELHRVPVGRSEATVNAIFDAIEQALNHGERVEIRGFGSFEVRDYKGYTGRNPRTGSTVEVKPKRLAFFKVGKELKERVQRAARKVAWARGAEGSGVDSSPAPLSAVAHAPIDRLRTREGDQLTGEIPIGVEMAVPPAPDPAPDERANPVASLHQRAMVTAGNAFAAAPVVRPAHR